MSLFWSVSLLLSTYNFSYYFNSFPIILDSLNLPTPTQGTAHRLSISERLAVLSRRFNFSACLDHFFYKGFKQFDAIGKPAVVQTAINDQYPIIGFIDLKIKWK